MLERNQTIKDLFKPNSEAELAMYFKILQNIDTDDLIDFKIYVLNNKNQYETFDVALVRLAKEFEARKLLKALQKGKFRFTNKYQMLAFLKANFKNKDIASGVGMYRDMVIIALNKDNRFVNRYTLKELTSDEEGDFLEALFNEQYKIGVVRRLSTKEIRELEARQEEARQILKLETEQKKLEAQKLESQKYDQALDRFFKKLENKIVIIKA
ncbi:hypothetical protein [Campylobacter ureolyticus]|uniref:Uncharacterized protein n=1 Tax=Campylobacter ureolyticus TaxID=827 RepID=A0A9Q4PUC0_9BACT|nr:hypothetical protein [Campylobacter ureolyticus]MCZ6161947.1 hypothetical protein [Campylobacter ureolyticus]MCZ6170977.1 hypothetical protein [Campylobacter ureolyticus]MDU4981078.1 hypothetical protein [Campylobacter ureolyticus]